MTPVPETQGTGTEARRNSLAKCESNSFERLRRRVLRWSLLPAAGVFALMAAIAPASAATQTTEEAGSFEIAQHGRTVGTASFRCAEAKNGYDSTSLVKVAMEGLEYALSKNEVLSPANHLDHVLLSATVNGEAVSVEAKPDAAQFVMNISAQGKSTTTRLDTHKGAVFLPDFDPGALETLLALAAEQNNRDLWAILPKQSGSIEPIQLATLPDQNGKLDGKEITVHHLVATIAGADTDLFSGPKNELLQAELPQEGFALIRKGFVLTPPAKPEAPRAE
jgi:hypothetical protein